jgi:hypothetical protein
VHGEYPEKLIKEVFECMVTHLRLWQKDKVLIPKKHATGRRWVSLTSTTKFWTGINLIIDSNNQAMGYIKDLLRI